MGTCIGSDWEFNVGLEAANGATLSTRSERIVVVIMIVQETRTLACTRLTSDPAAHLRNLLTCVDTVRLAVMTPQKHPAGGPRLPTKFVHRCQHVALGVNLKFMHLFYSGPRKQRIYTYVKTTVNNGRKVLGAESKAQSLPR
jgi:hypothetical protein